jgi:hypothetical protein
MINETTTFGIEIETQVPCNLGLQIGHHGGGLSVRRVTLPNGEQVQAPVFAGESWKADSDPSIRTLNGYNKCEFVSPILRGDQGLQHILDFLTFLKRIGAKRPIRTGGETHGGIHITIHAGSACGSRSPADILNWCEKVARLGFRLSPVLYGQNAERRDRSRWCPVLPSRSQDAEIKRAKETGRCQIHIGKYALINFSKLGSTGCIEFRSFSTTLNPTKVMLILASVLTVCQEANNENLPNWASSRRLNSVKSHELFKTVWSWASRRYVTKKFPTLRRLSRLMFNWGYASCLFFDRLRFGGSIAPQVESFNSEALELMGTAGWQSHVRGAI